ncbi:MAG: histidine ammonia-lyase [Thermoplasmata archaeon]
MGGAPLPIDGRSLTLGGFLAVVRGGRPAVLSPDAVPAMEQGRAAVERATAAGEAVYGITTGFGALSTTRIAPAEARELQRSLVESHASGLGPPLPREVVRGMTLLRANSLARGRSGVRPEVVRHLLAILNADRIPWVPETGSVGASGDLAPLAHLARALVGTGAFVGPGGEAVPARRVLGELGLAPIALEAKEGLALVNGTALMTSYLALGLDAAGTLLEAAEIAAALAFDALRGAPEALDDRWGELRGAPEERAIAADLRALLRGSELAVPRSEWAGQDPYTLRCLPQVLAPVRHALRAGRTILDGELNAVTDNPVLLDGARFASGGNFHGQSLAWAMDALALAIHALGGYSERRIARLVHPGLNRGLPAFLAPRPGVSSGFMIPQTVAAALVNENGTLVHPATAFSLSTSADQEDFVSMGAWAGAKLHRLLANVRRIVAIEWIAAAQGLELRRPARGGDGSEAAWTALRRIVPAWTDDRSPGPEIERVAAAIADRSLIAPVRAAVPGIGLP